MMIALFLALLAADAPAESGEVWASGEWRHEVIVDPITDVRRHVMSITSDNTFFALKCDSPGKKHVYAHAGFGEWLGIRRANPLSRNRVDDRKYILGGWRTHRREALDMSPAKLVAEMKGGRKLAIQVGKYDYSDATAVFDITGADEAISRLYEACGDVAP